MKTFFVQYPALASFTILSLIALIAAAIRRNGSTKPAEEVPNEPSGERAGGVLLFPNQYRTTPAGTVNARTTTISHTFETPKRVSGMSGRFTAGKS